MKMTNNVNVNNHNNNTNNDNDNNDTIMLYNDNNNDNNVTTTTTTTTTTNINYIIVLFPTAKIRTSTPIAWNTVCLFRTRYCKHLLVDRYQLLSRIIICQFMFDVRACMLCRYFHARYVSLLVYDVLSCLSLSFRVVAARPRLPWFG